MTIDIETVLRTDALAQAEKITGKSYKDDKITLNLGLVMYFQNNVTKDSLLSAAGDTTYSMSYDDYIRVLKRLDFRCVYHEPFEGHTYSGEAVPTEVFEVWWHDDGLLLKLDTHQTTHRNSATVYYNWKPNSPKFDRGILSTHHWMDSGRDGIIAIGNHDAREALVFNLDRLREDGQFLNPWIEQPFLYLSHYADDRDRNVVKAEVIRALPTEVWRAISCMASA